jgi:hypothetical protein
VQEQTSVDIKEEDLIILSKVLHFLYFGNYHNPDEQCTLQTHPIANLVQLPQVNDRINNASSIEKTTGPVALTFSLLTHHAETYRSADRYGIQPLKELAANCFLQVMKTPMDNIVFGKGLSLAYYHRSSSQCLLSKEITKLYLFNHQDVLCHPNLVAIVKKHETAAWGIASQVGKGYTEIMEHAAKALILDGVQHTGDCDCDYPYGTHDVDDLDVKYMGQLRYEVEYTCSRCDQVISWTTESA